jgi:hypothetical protein
MSYMIKVMFGMTVNIGIDWRTGGGGITGLQPPATSTPHQIEIKKSTYFVDTVITKLLCSLRFSLSQLPILADV